MLRRALRRGCAIQLLSSSQTIGLRRPSTSLPTLLRWIPRDTPSSVRAIGTTSSQDDTIYALSSAQGKAGIAVIRISGPACLDVYRALCPSKPPLKPRYAAIRTLFHPPTPNTPPSSSILDSTALLLHFPSPRTVTGEDILELHIHGGPATVRAVLAAIPHSRAPGLIRYAEPGEFTRRAFQHGRLDLAQVEALADTLAAETEQQRRAAVRGSSGALGRTYEGWRQELLLARGELEALIDFSEDQHFDEEPGELLGNVRAVVGGILRAVEVHEGAGRRGELLRSGIRIALVGPPNVGKSSLMNLVVGREASIVSTEEGTTRDVVEVSLDIRGYLCTFADTAGFRSTQHSGALPASGMGSPTIGPVEEEGIRRARRKALDSDIVIVLASVEPDGGGGFKVRYDPETLQLAANAQQCLVAINKGDSVAAPQLSSLAKAFRDSALADVPGLSGAEPLLISCKEAEAQRTKDDAGGIQGLVQRLAHSFAAMTSLPAELQDLLGVTERQRQLLADCRTHLEDFMAEADKSAEGKEGEDGEPDIVLAAEHLRFAANCLARITGRGDGGDVEEVLGVIFEKY